MTRNQHHHFDPRGLIYESYRIEGITPEECRSIFLDWALGQEADTLSAHVVALLEFHGKDAPEHPMTAVLREGVAPARRPKRRGGARARHRSKD